VSFVAVRGIVPHTLHTSSVGVLGFTYRACWLELDEMFTLSLARKRRFFVNNKIRAAASSANYAGFCAVMLLISAKQQKKIMHCEPPRSLH